MQTIEKTIGIDAPIEKVYEVLVNPQFTRAWGNAFSEGAYVESDWKAGALPESDVLTHSPLWDKALLMIKELAEK